MSKPKLPVFSGTEMQRLQKCIRWVKRNVALQRWQNQRVAREFSVRSPKQIIASGQTFYMGNCLDRTIVLMQALKKNNFRPKMVVEGLEHSRYGRYMHFGIELKIGGKQHFVDFASRDKVLIGQGQYVNASKMVQRISVKRFPSALFSMKANFWNATGVTPKTLGLKDFSSEANVKRMQRDNAAWRYLYVKTSSMAHDALRKLRPKKGKNIRV